MQEAVEKIRTIKNYRGTAAIKIDLEKAYDRLDSISLKKLWNSLMSPKVSSTSSLAVFVEASYNLVHSLTGDLPTWPSFALHFSFVHGIPFSKHLESYRVP